MPRRLPCCPPRKKYLDSDSQSNRDESKLKLHSTPFRFKIRICLRWGEVCPAERDRAGIIYFTALVPMTCPFYHRAVRPCEIRKGMCCLFAAFRFVLGNILVGVGEELDSY
ncbi:hypothetical protein CBL_00352 [Carabus blaptoides fortunei]